MIQIAWMLSESIENGEFKGREPYFSLYFKINVLKKVPMKLTDTVVRKMTQGVCITYDFVFSIVMCVVIVVQPCLTLQPHEL